MVTSSHRAVPGSPMRDESGCGAVGGDGLGPGGEGSRPHPLPVAGLGPRYPEDPPEHPLPPAALQAALDRTGGQSALQGLAAGDETVLRLRQKSEGMVRVHHLHVIGEH